MTTRGNAKGRISGHMTEHEIKELLSEYGIAVPKGRVIDSIDDVLDFKYPVVLKVSDSSILHKSDVGGVKTGIADLQTLKSAFSSMSESFPDRKFLLEEMAKPGLEAIIGVVKDRNFGHALMLGMGGIYTELCKDVVFRLLPIDRLDAEEMVESVGISMFLQGYRGVTVSKEVVVSLLMSVSRIVEEVGEGLLQMDLNPVILSEETAIAVDAKLTAD